MKTNSLSRFAQSGHSLIAHAAHFQRRRSSVSASALLFVLASLALITIVTLAFFSIVTSETTASSAQLNTTVAANLSESTVSLVMGTISTATSGTNSSGNPVAWASQPGAIRTWDNSGALSTVYRLYSSPNIADNAYSATADATAITSGANKWQAGSNPYNALYCDLNSPVSIGGTTNVYPIVTPPLSLDANNGVPTDDPTTPTQGGVQGFGITSPPGFNSSLSISPVNNPAPMPVQWLYVLKGGQLVAPDNTSTTSTANFSGTTAPTAANPIVGRIAYWTDDETCKVNVNTASQGVFWAVPTLFSQTEGYLGRNQPGQNEFQRYPGHPATTCLSAIFPNFAGNYSSTYDLATNTSSSVYDLVPRVVYANPSGQGGSLGGTGQATALLAPLIPDADRLFASVDEFFYKPTVDASNPPKRVTATGAFSSVFSGAASDAALSAAINQTKFFLTASSRAPEVTMFNTPRISLWPITTDSTTVYTYANQTRMDAFDKVLKFCGTLGNNDYFFVRANPLSTTFDMDTVNSPTSRNVQIYKYLQNLLGTPIPGFGGSFSSKYGAADRDALLTEAFDYIRSGPDLVRTSDMIAGRVQAGYTLASGQQPTAQFSNLVLPIRVANTGNGGVDGTVGMGNFHFITEVGLGFYTEQVLPANAGYVNQTSLWPAAQDPLTNAPPNVLYQIRPQLLVQTVCPTMGWGRAPSILNPSHTSPVTQSLRYQATLTSASANPVTLGAVSPGIKNVGGTVNFPWGKLCELRGTPAYDASNPYGPYYNNPQDFMLAAGSRAVDVNLTDCWQTGQSSTTGTSGCTSSSPASTQGKNAISYIDWSGHTTPNFTPAAPNKATQLGYALPPSIAGATNSSGAVTNKYQFWMERIQGLMTAPDATTSSSGSTEYPAWTVPPRMKLSPVVQMEIQVGFPPDTVTSFASTGDTNVTQTFIVNFNDLTNLPVPSQTYAPAAGLNYNMLATNTVTDITTWPNYYIHQSIAGYSTNGLSPIPASIVTAEQSANSGFTSFPNTTANLFYAFGYRFFKGNGAQAGSPYVCDVASSPIVQPGDVIRTQQINGVTPTAVNYSPGGDWRWVVLQASRSPSTSTTWFGSPTPGGSLPAKTLGSYTGNFTGSDHAVHAFGMNLLSMVGVYGGQQLVSGINYMAKSAASASTVFTADFLTQRQTSSSLGTGSDTTGAAVMANGQSGDWNDGYAQYQGGATFSMPDIAAMGPPDQTNASPAPNHWSYFSGIGGPGILAAGADGVTDTLQYQLTYSPNRQMYSPMQMGSLLTQVADSVPHPWQTLLFCPNSAADVNGYPTLSHPGNGTIGGTTPPDHLFADLFWMPVVDPYPISEALSTAGKINLNYAIQPFGYIRRATGLHALLKSTMITAITDTYATTSPTTTYKYYNNSFPPNATSLDVCRYPIAENETLKAFDAKFAAGDIFRSGSQISEMFLYPGDTSQRPLPAVTYDAANANIISWWTTRHLTGKNNRDLPYSYLYPRVTTKSNTFTVHLRVEGLKKRPNSTQTSWQEGQDTVVSEYRGSALIERYLDPSDSRLTAANLGDIVANDQSSSTSTLSPYYNWRVVQRHQFSP